MIMLIEKDSNKEKSNLVKHGLDFSFSEHIFQSLFAVTVYDRYDGEHRWHTFAYVGSKVLLVVHTYPDPDDDSWVRVIGLREATSHERRLYEEGDFD